MSGKHSSACVLWAVFSNKMQNKGKYHVMAKHSTFLLLGSVSKQDT